ncbi:TonB-dependent receptor [Gaoshiqia sp. Z1-71]|uniref:TonB-dependent receptor n=1 Tax=Gaoshiqia hydrogeniformans TaxID=3290090 RepID=UPI003BF8D34C
MRLIVFFLLAGIFQVSAISSYSQQTRLSLNFADARLTEVLNEIENKSEFYFLYNQDLIDVNRRVNVQVENQKIETVLDQLFRENGVKYVINNRQIILIGQEEKNSSMQQGTIGGRVTNSSGEPIPGATVVIKGTSMGTITDFSGNYTISNVTPNAVLVFSFVGMRTREITLSGQSVVNASLEEETIGIEEVVAIGYGTVKKSDLTGSVSSIKTEDLKKVPVTSFDQAIQGRASGVQVTQASSAPGGRVVIRVRGGNSLSSSNEPLYVVDGYPISAGSSAGGSGAGQNPLATLNTSDIASIEILKDASATAIYGARGANGVVLITTKRGQIGKTQVTFDGYSGVQQVANKLDMMNAREFAELVNEARANDGLSPAFPNNSNLYNFPDPSSLGKGVDYQDEIFRSALIHSYNLGISGGNDAVRYAVGGSFFGQTGIVEGTDFNRASFRSNIDSKLAENLTVATNFTASHVWGSIGSSEGDGGNNAGVVNSAILMPPTVPVKQEDGSYTQMNPTPGGSTIQNPVPIALLATNYQEIERILGSVEANWEIIDGLSLKVTFGTDMSSANRQVYWPKETVNGFNANGSASQANRKMASYLNENILTYNKSVGDHSLNVLGGYTWQTFHNQYFSAGATNFPTDIYGANNLGAGTAYSQPSSDKNQSQLASYLGRINYIYKGRYLLTLTGRADGSSKFGANNKWAFFPSVAAAWRISEENFMSSVSAVNNLKLRLSYGQTGNQDISSYQSLAKLGTMNYAFNGVLNAGVGPNNIPNPDLKWETTSTTDIGFDLGAFDNRLTLVVDYYYKKTTDLLWNISTPQTIGFPSIFKNIGSLENKGIEVSVGGDIFTGKFTWNTQANWSRNRNKVLEIPGYTPSVQGSLSGHLKVNGSWLEPGLPIGVWNLLKYDGVFQDQAQLDAGPRSSTNDKLGSARFIDKSNDGKINYTDDRMIVGDPNPDFIFGWSNNFSYKGFDLSIYMQGSYGNDIINVQRAETNVSGPWGNQRREILNRWTPTNTHTDISRARVTVDPLLLQSSWLIEDGSYLRVKTMTFGYTFNKIKLMESLRVYVTGQNLITLTDYSGFDPEVNSQGNSNLQMGVDYNAYPAAKAFIFGISASF